MARWKWFQRQDAPIDVVQRSAYQERAGAYRARQPERNAPTAVLRRQLPLLRLARLWRSRHAVRRCHRRSYR
ncbi:hypothetical protein [Micromonospora lutea]|uniref:hypothetical protein n=1 Tax=Micromonospora TaxID=1873 RepID=UPI001950C79E|nr:hypothetical protein [Micromonospora lutea]